MFDQEDPNERPSFDQLLLRMKIMMTKDTLYLDLKEDGKKMIPLIVRPNPEIQFDTTHNQKLS